MQKLHRSIINTEKKQQASQTQTQERVNFKREVDKQRGAREEQIKSELSQKGPVMNSGEKKKKKKKNKSGKHVTKLQ